MTGKHRLHLSSAAFERRGAGMHDQGVLSVTDMLIVDVVAGRRVTAEAYARGSSRHDAALKLAGLESARRSVERQLE